MFEEWERHLSHHGRLDELLLLFSDSKKAGEDHLMRELELAARRSRHRTKTTHSDPNARVAPNRLDREFTATRPNEKWAGDITAIWT